MATLIKTNGEISQLLPQNEKVFTLKELQAVVGGYIQMLRLPNGTTLVCNEDGIDLELPVNKDASRLVAGMYGRKTQMFVGDILLVSESETK